MSEENKKNKSSEKTNSSEMTPSPFVKHLDYIIGGVVIVALVVALVFVVTNKKDDKVRTESSSDKEITGEEISEKEASKIEEKLEVAFSERFAPEAEVVFDAFREEKGLYKIYLTIDGKDFEVYLTKDYEMFIPQNINLKELLDEIEEESKIDVVAENKKALGFEKNSKPRLDYFVMSFCPYGNPADENASKIHAAFGDSVEIVPHYILSPDGENGYNSLHGVIEAHQDIRELCVLENYGKDKFFEFTLASNEALDSKNADTNWKDVALKTGVNVNTIANCEETKGIEIAKREMETSENTKVKGNGGVSSIAASPTVLVNGDKVSNSATAIQKALCEEFADGEKPAACDQSIEEAATAAAGSCN